jgi:exonuclease III
MKTIQTKRRTGEVEIPDIEPEPSPVSDLMAALKEGPRPREADDITASMRLVSWNVAGRVKHLPEQAECLLSLNADVVCLQEVTARTLPLWQALLAAGGYSALAHGELPPAGCSRPLAVLTASRTTVHAVLVEGVPWPERVLAVHLSDGTEIVNVHSPISPKPDFAKIRTHEAVHRHLADRSAGYARILCGDLNTPRKEHSDGSVWTFARDRYGRLRGDRGKRWDQAELALIRGLERYGYRDAFRLLHPHAYDEISWGWARGNGGYRLDHLIVSSDLGVEECHYKHSWREEGLSDHSALVATLKQAVPQPANGAVRAHRWPAATAADHPT